MKPVTGRPTNRVVTVSTGPPVGDGLRSGVLVHDGAKVVQHSRRPGGVEVALRGDGEAMAHREAIGEYVAAVVGPVDLVGDRQRVQVARIDPGA